MQGWDSGPWGIRRPRDRSGAVRRGRLAVFSRVAPTLDLDGGEAKGPSREGGSNCSGEEAPPSFSASHAIVSEMLRKDAMRVRFATRLREPNAVSALRGRFQECGAAPRRERMFHVKHLQRAKRRAVGSQEQSGRGEGQDKAFYVRTNVSRETSGAGRARCDGAGRAKCGGAASSVRTDWAKLGFGERARTKGATFQRGGRA
ncbi:hypothetical protein BN3658_01813 [Coriobacteriaceae bacterium CHKCI002]|nr:hypothetical protein BN3658_01813 [Coriobacteriaceae bacterium CHKCI002]